MPTKIKAQSRVQLNFSLSLSGGELVDSNFDTSPVAMQIGDGNMLAGFETHLIGMSAGEKKEVLVSAAEAFGEYKEENLQQFDRQHFSADVELQEGLILSFADANGAELPGVVKAIKAQSVEVDFNHPLAGREIVFKVKVVSVDNNDNE